MLAYLARGEKLGDVILISLTWEVFKDENTTLDILKLRKH